MDAAALDLAIACLGSLRDLSCGSALNRAAVLAWTPPSRASLQTEYLNHELKFVDNGIHVLSSYAFRYDRWEWEDILSIDERTAPIIDSESKSSPYLMQQSMGAVTKCMYTERGKQELRLLTNVLGAIRNTSHSTPENCQAFFNYGLTNVLLRRLTSDFSAEKRVSQTTTATTNISFTALSHKSNVCSLSSSLPDATCPWREASYRAAGCLINLAEKCPAVAYQLGSNRRLIYLLIETWGGASAIAITKNTNASKRGLPLLHLGLAAILHAANSGALEGGLDEIMVQVLEKEKIRKKEAQRREEERKHLKMRKQKSYT